MERQQEPGAGRGSLAGLLPQESTAVACTICSPNCTPVSRWRGALLRSPTHSSLLHPAVALRGLSGLFLSWVPSHQMGSPPPPHPLLHLQTPWPQAGPFLDRKAEAQGSLLTKLSGGSGISTPNKGTQRTYVLGVGRKGSQSQGVQEGTGLGLRGCKREFLP